MEQLPRGVTKRLLYPGKHDAPDFKDSSKAVFHYRVFRLDENGEKIEIDDSKKLGQPFELIYGKKFKLDVWEEIVKTMKIGEVSEFHCKAYVTKAYPIVAKSLRDMAKKKHGHTDNGEEHHHSCGIDALQRGLGYKDLDDILQNDHDLIFEIELLKVKLPGEYEKDLWAMTGDEKLNKIPKWKDEGNRLFKSGEYERAAELYAKALGCLEQLSLREKPGDDEWLELDKMKIPFLLNYSQCKLNQKEYYEVIKHTTTVLEKDATNVKALYRRAKAHVGCWNPEEALKDFSKVAELDSSLKATVTKEINKLNEEIRIKYSEDKSKWKGVF